MDIHTNKIITQYLNKFGDFCLAYSTTQPNLEYFYICNIGYIAYIRYRYTFILPKDKIIMIGNPVCDEKDYSFIIKEFIRSIGQEIIFLHHDERLNHILEDIKYKTNMFGIETILDLKTFSLQGKNRAKLRQWINKSHRENIVCEEIKINAANYEQLKEISEIWLARKRSTNCGILTRPFIDTSELDVRIFIAKKNDKIIAFAGFDPMYQNGKIIGYYHNFDRMLPNIPNGTGSAILFYALHKFKSENIRIISLGLSPLYKLKNHATQNKFTIKALRFTFKYLNFIYPFQGNARHKKKFDGKIKPIYFSSNNNSIFDLITILFSLGA